MTCRVMVNSSVSSSPASSASSGAASRCPDCFTNGPCDCAAMRVFGLVRVYFSNSTEYGIFSHRCYACQNFDPTAEDGYGSCAFGILDRIHTMGDRRIVWLGPGDVDADYVPPRCRRYAEDERVVTLRQIAAQREADKPKPKHKTGDRVWWRWKVARLIEWLDKRRPGGPRWCWAELALWALHGYDASSPSGLRPIIDREHDYSIRPCVRECDENVDRLGCVSCWCGKVLRERSEK